MYTPKVLLTLVALIAGGSPYPTGAPGDVCDTMAPGHGVLPQNGKFPYDIVIDKLNLKSGESTRVTIRGKDGQLFRGYMMQARKENNPVGEFIVSDTNSHILDCGTGKANTVTQSNADDKKEVTVTWTAPENFEGNVVFYVTVVKVFDTYWVAHHSVPVRIS